VSLSFATFEILYLVGFLKKTVPELYPIEDHPKYCTNVIAWKATEVASLERQ
jgi:hypothetical protein